MKFFKVTRGFDETDVSGIGHVIDGAIFGDGTVVIKWLTDRSSIAIYKNFEDFKAIHIDSHPLNETVTEMIDIGVLEAIKKHWEWMKDGDSGSDSFWIAFNHIKELLEAS